jgi:hypothetical protein
MANLFVLLLATAFIVFFSISLLDVMLKVEKSFVKLGLQLLFSLLFNLWSFLYFLLWFHFVLFLFLRLHWFHWLFRWFCFFFFFTILFQFSLDHFGEKVILKLFIHLLFSIIFQSLLNLFDVFIAIYLRRLEIIINRVQRFSRHMLIRVNNDHFFVLL